MAQNLSFLIHDKCCDRQYGEYQVIKPIGEGRNGVCFLAQAKYGTQVVIKRFKPTMLKKNIDKNSYEAVILSKLKHEAIPELLGVINEKGFYGFALGFKSGITVEDMLFRQKHIFTKYEIYSIGSQLISLLKYLHENGIVHRDICIQNTLISDGIVSLLDFGLARFEDGKRYTKSLDYFCFGDILLNLIYSSYSVGKKPNRYWYNELSLNYFQEMFLKKLLKIEEPYESIDELAENFELFYCI